MKLLLHVEQVHAFIYSIQLSQYHPTPLLSYEIGMGHVNERKPDNANLRLSNKNVLAWRHLIIKIILKYVLAASIQMYNFKLSSLQYYLFYRLP